MSQPHSKRVYLAVAVMIAAAAFGAGQIQSGAGVLVALFGSTAWVAWNSKRSLTRG